MAGSILSYGVTRNYPYRFFTLLVFILGLAFLVLFSFINFASSGFRLVVQYTTNPNSTITGSWSYGLPKLLAGKITPFCQPTLINGQTKLATTNNALFCTMTSLQPYGNNTFLPSLVYLNNPLESCSVSQVVLYMERTEGRTALQIAGQSWGITLLAISTCQVQLDDGIVVVNMTTEFDPYSANVTTPSSDRAFLGQNKSSRASLYWGESLLANHRVHLNNELNAGNIANTKSDIVLTVRGSGEDITDLNYFNVLSRTVAFHVELDGGDYNSSYNSTGIYNEPTSGLLYSDQDMLWIAADNLAKSFISVILTDLGQTTAKLSALQGHSKTEEDQTMDRRDVGSQSLGIPLLRLEGSPRPMSG